MAGACVLGEREAGPHIMTAPCQWPLKDHLLEAGNARGRRFKDTAGARSGPGSFSLTS